MAKIGTDNMNKRSSNSRGAWEPKRTLATHIPLFRRVFPGKVRYNVNLETKKPAYESKCGIP